MCFSLLVVQRAEKTDSTFSALGEIFLRLHGNECFYLVGTSHICLALLLCSKVPAFFVKKCLLGAGTLETVADMSVLLNCVFFSLSNQQSDLNPHCMASCLEVKKTRARCFFPPLAHFCYSWHKCFFHFLCFLGSSFGQVSSVCHQTTRRRKGRKRKEE